MGAGVGLDVVGSVDEEAEYTDERQSVEGEEWRFLSKRTACAVGSLSGRILGDMLQLDSLRIGPIDGVGRS